MNIKQASTATGLPAKTIRYYEEITLIHPARGGNGYRDFSAQDVHKLAFLGRARALGFTIADCRVLLALYEDADRSSAEVKSLAKTHLTEIDSKIQALSEMRETLAHLVETCAGDERPDCPILASLAAPNA